MKTLTYYLILMSAFLVETTASFAGLEWNKGTLGNPDNLHRLATAVAYDPGGAIYVAGIEENSSGSRQIVTKKYSASGLLLYSTTNIYIIPVGTIVSDFVNSIAIDASGNVYVLGSQFATDSRGNDIVLLKYNSSLNLQWRRYLYNDAYPNTNYNDTPCNMLLDASGNIYISGTWYNATTPDDDQVVVRKYNSGGTVIYTSVISESSIKIVGKAADMCLDNASNITLLAGVEYNNVNKIVFVRVNAAGTVEWTNYYDPQSGYNFITKAKIRCSPAGNLYISAAMWKMINASDYASKLMTSQFTQSGTKVWDRFTPLINYYPNEIQLSIDVNENLYTGSWYSGPQGSGAEKFRIYKYNSAGSLQWTYISSEAHNQFLNFAPYQSSALFVVHYDNSVGYAKLKKLNVSTGLVIWSENISVATPPGYTYADTWPAAISVNSITSEVAYCGYLSGATGSPGFDTERRWNVRKYGATSPRLADENVSASNNDPSVNYFPNPVNESLHVQFANSNLPTSISMYDIQGNLLKRIESGIDENTVFPVNDLPAGMILIHAQFQDAVVVRKITVSH